MLDAIVIGAGPNGLAAAIRLAEQGHSVRVYETHDRPGGGARSAEASVPGVTYDLGAAIHPLAFASPWLSSLPLDRYGLEWVHPPVALAHPLDSGDAVLLRRDLTATGQTLGVDAERWRELFEPLIRNAADLLDDTLAPVHLPDHPRLLARFGIQALRPAATFASSTFASQQARALFAGLAAHSFLPLEELVSAAFGLVLGMLGHTTGWPFPRGGAQQLSNALAAYLAALGGEIVTGTTVSRLADLPPARTYLFDTSAAALSQIAEPQLPRSYRRKLGRMRQAPGVFKVDYVLSEPVPWTAAECRDAGTLHLGGTLEEIAASERAVSRGGHPDAPFIIAAQPTLFDPTRAPDGIHTLWAYCHVPNGSTVDMTAIIDAQIERFAPGFRERVIARQVMFPADIEAVSANFIGGDISVGRPDLRQTFTRPVVRRNPYTTPNPRIFLCSAATPPGGGVHGMCGYHAATAALKRLARDRSLSVGRT